METIRVLLVEDSSTDEKLLRKELAHRVDPRFDIDIAETLTQAIIQCNKESYSVVLLDLNLIDSEGL